MRDYERKTARFFWNTAACLLGAVLLMWAVGGPVGIVACSVVIGLWILHPLMTQPRGPRE